MGTKKPKKDKYLHFLLSVAGTGRKTPTKYQKKLAKDYIKEKAKGKKKWPKLF